MKYIIAITLLASLSFSQAFADNIASPVLPTPAAADSLPVIDAVPPTANGIAIHEGNPEIMGKIESKGLFVSGATAARIEADRATNSVVNTLEQHIQINKILLNDDHITNFISSMEQMGLKYYGFLETGSTAFCDCQELDLIFVKYIASENSQEIMRTRIEETARIEIKNVSSLDTATVEIK